MPINTAYPFKFKRDELYAAFAKGGPLLQYLKQRWEDTNPDDTERTPWDVALVEAYLKPSLASIEPVAAPPENTDRAIHVYTRMSVAEMTKDYFLSIKNIKINR